MTHAVFFNLRFVRHFVKGSESSPRHVWMNKGDFDASIRDLVPARWIPEEDKQRLSQARGRKT